MTVNSPAQPKTKRVMIVDDSPIVRSDLCTLLEMAADLEIIGEACNGEEAVLQAVGLHPDVILMDLEMPIMSGYDATRKIKDHLPACRVIVLSVHGYPEARQRASLAGADVFLVKGEPVENLVSAIQKEL